MSIERLRDIIESSYNPPLLTYTALFQVDESYLVSRYILASS